MKPTRGAPSRNGGGHGNGNDNVHGNGGGHGNDNGNGYDYRALDCVWWDCWGRWKGGRMEMSIE